MLVSSSEEVEVKRGIGQKARRLLELTHAGYRVPPFAVVTSTEAQRVSTDPTLLQELVSQIKEHVPSEKYAVRSAVLIEDGEVSSYAGQFTTILSVSPSALGESIKAVISDALTKLTGGFADCSVIVQEYIEPDYSGIIFTRNPLGGREMVVEYRQGVGDKVVGGEESVRIQFLYSGASGQAKVLSNIKELAETARSIEERYDFPQDIEWAMKDGVTYVLQTRPITSVSQDSWRGLRLAEATFPENEVFYFERTSLSETFSRPRPLSLSILQALHKKESPIERAYKNIGVSYQANEKLFHQFGNELFINKDVETKTLFPSLGHTKNNSETPSWETFSGTLTTLTNVWSLSRISHNRYKEQHERVVNLLSEKRDEGMSLKDRFDLLLNSYPLIFEINICAQKALSNMERHLGKDSKYLPGLLAVKTGSDTGEDTNELHESLQGNSLNIDDVSNFVSRRSAAEDPTSSAVTDAWWNSLPMWKQVGLTPFVMRAKEYMELRETARVLSVRLIGHLRKGVQSRSQEIFGESPDRIYFATIDELITGTQSSEVCEEREKRFAENEGIVMPSYIASFVKTEKKEGSIGISSGKAEGVLVTRDGLKNISGNKILYTDILSPDLVQYFDQIVGIVSKNGGMLSHLAIMAREAHIPVVVTNGDVDVSLGQVVSIDGLTGEITNKI